MALGSSGAASLTVTESTEPTRTPCSTTEVALRCDHSPISGRCWSPEAAASRWARLEISIPQAPVIPGVQAPELTNR